MKSDISPLLIIGTQRSGSNLLRLILNQSPFIEAPHPPHILTTFMPLLPAYGNLEEAGNFHQLVEDIAGFIGVNPVPWQHVDLNPAEIIKRCKRPSLMEIFRVVYTLKAEVKGARYWCCKSMSNVYFIPEIEQAGLKPFYLYLVRDGRDVAASFKKAIVGEKHIYFIAKKWDQEQRLAMEMMAKYAEGRTAMVKFEEFIRNPKTALAPVLRMLNLEWNDDMLEYYKSEEAKITAAAGDMWKNVIKPIDSGNMRHYSEKLSAEEILMFEEIAGESLVKLDYPPDNKAHINARFTEEQLAGFKQQNTSMKTEARKEHQLDLHTRAGQENFLQQIKARLAVTNGANTSL